ncbi:hypothetical protein BKA64DRAFT_773785 [Cadophora sp. MPI-SDFR-AT-0126]|nr:hypothetical protein BKA64DRAFT_773785 [Leotiomycetes sp. MPI-SDFR-AT-0126]
MTTTYATAAYATEAEYKEIRSRRRPHAAYMSVLSSLYSTNPGVQAAVRNLFENQQGAINFCRRVMEMDHIYEVNIKSVGVTSTQPAMKIGDNKPHMGLFSPIIDTMPKLKSDINKWFKNLPSDKRGRIRRIGRDVINLDKTTLIRTRGNRRLIDEPPIDESVLANFRNWRSRYRKEVEWDLNQIDDSLVDSEDTPQSSESDEIGGWFVHQEDVSMLSDQPARQSASEGPPELEVGPSANIDTIDTAHTEIPHSSGNGAPTSQAVDATVQPYGGDHIEETHVEDDWRSIQSKPNGSGTDNRDRSVSGSQAKSNNQHDLPNRTETGANETSKTKRKRSDTNQETGPESKFPRPPEKESLQRNLRAQASQPSTPTTNPTSLGVWPVDSIRQPEILRERIEAKGYSTSFLDSLIGTSSRQGQLKEASKSEILGNVFGLHMTGADGSRYRPSLKTDLMVVQKNGVADRGAPSSPDGLQQSATSSVQSPSQKTRPMQPLQPGSQSEYSALARSRPELSTENPGSPQLESHPNADRPLSSAATQSAPPVPKERERETESSHVPTPLSHNLPGSSSDNPLLVDDIQDTPSSQAHPGGYPGRILVGDRGESEEWLHRTTAHDSTTRYQQLPPATGHQDSPGFNHMQSPGPAIPQLQTRLNPNQYTLPPTQHLMQRQMMQPQGQFDGSRQQMGLQHMDQPQTGQQSALQPQMGPRHMGQQQGPDTQRTQTSYQHFRQRSPGHHNVRMPREQWRSHRSPSKSPKNRNHYG